jgi:hypothetical protein
MDMSQLSLLTYLDSHLFGSFIKRFNWNEDSKVQSASWRLQRAAEMVSNIDVLLRPPKESCIIEGNFDSLEAEKQ